VRGSVSVIVLDLQYNEARHVSLVVECISIINIYATVDSVSVSAIDQ